MRVRIAVALLSFFSFSQNTISAKEVFVPLISGEVYADGRPIDRVVEVRLEASNSSLVASAYTFGSQRFTFRNVSIVWEDNYFLVIKDLAFKELRHELHLTDFTQDSASSSIVHFGASIILELQSLPPEKKAGNEKRTGPKSVDARQLKAEIPGEARREYNLALERSGANDPTGALAHLEKAVALAPEYYDALNKLGAEYMRSGQYSKAEAILKRACVLNPNDPLPLTNLGILYLQYSDRQDFITKVKGVGDTESGRNSLIKAAEFFEKALRLNPLAPRANLHLGTALYKLGDYEKAETLLLNTLGLDDQMHEARLLLINIYHRQKRYEDALKQIAVYLQANPGSPDRKQLEALQAQMQASSY
jgi:tetratricopeptide (TPR) repeat protein